MCWLSLIVGIFIGFPLGLLTLGLVASGKIEDLYREIAVMREHLDKTKS
jgi:hypothetical protein